MIHNDTPQPEIESRATDGGGHVWSRRSNGWWYCERNACHLPMAWSWEDVLAAAVDELTVRPPAWSWRQRLGACWVRRRDAAGNWSEVPL